jgi:hypothetical protein
LNGARKATSGKRQSTAQDESDREIKRFHGILSLAEVGGVCARFNGAGERLQCCALAAVRIGSVPRIAIPATSHRRGAGKRPSGCVAANQIDRFFRCERTGALRRRSGAC